MMCTSHRRRRQRGQALAEAAISLPLLVLVSFGVFDLGTMVDTQTIVKGEVRAGLTEAVASADYTNNPIGTAILDAANNIGVADNLATWGPGFPGGVTSGCSTNCDDDCSVSGIPCGDPNGCDTSSSWWSASSTVSACFSVGSATNHPATTGCDPPGWGMASRPVAGMGDCLFVTVVVMVKPETPGVSFLATNGGFYISYTETGVQLY
jgi:hypothetical protein